MNSFGGPLYQDICPSLHVHICLFLSEKHERPGPDLVVGLAGLDETRWVGRSGQARTQLFYGF